MKIKILNKYLCFIIIAFLSYSSLYGQKNNDGLNRTKKRNYNAPLDYPIADSLFNLEGSYLELQNSMISMKILKKLTFKYNGDWLTYGVVEVNGRFWLDRNLGARRVPLSMNDKGGFGHYFQWGREADGHQLLDSIVNKGTILPKSQPEHPYFIESKGTDHVGDWTKDIKWGYRWVNEQGVKVKADVCPDGWHVPTIKEWISIASHYKNDTAFFRSKLKLIKAGCNSSIQGDQRKQIYGFYWSSNFDIIGGRVKGKTLYFNNYKSVAGVISQQPSRGFPIRCIKDNE